MKAKPNNQNHKNNKKAKKLHAEALARYWKSRAARAELDAEFVRMVSLHYT